MCREEPDLLLDSVVHGATRLIRQGGFTMPASSKEAEREWLFGVDPVLAWLEEAVVVDGTGNAIRVRDAYEAFRSWAIAEGFHADRLPASNNFVQRVLAAEKAIGRCRSAAIAS